MSELCPEEFEKMLNSEGDLTPDDLPEEEKKVLMFAKLLQHSRTGSAGMRCFTCKGTMFFPLGSSYPCSSCNGKGWR